MYKIFDAPKDDHDVVNKLYVDKTTEDLIEMIESLQRQINEITSNVKVKHIQITGPGVVSKRADIEKH